MAQQIKNLNISLDGFRPIEEAISCAGGVKQIALSSQLQLQSNPFVFCCGEMLDWDAPTGGYLLTACFATGRAAGTGVHQYLISDTIR
jgi:predicted flavoprotein YhiN